MSTKTPETRPETIQLTLDDMAFEGAALGRFDGQVIFADYGIPEEEVIVRIESTNRHFLEGQVVDVLTPSPSRVEPPCPYFGRCGGCQWQHIEYGEQLRLKRHVMHDQLRRIGKIEDPPVSETVGSPNPYGYRNNARFSTDDEGSLGFITRGPSGREFLRINECMIMNPKINNLLAKLQGHGKDLHQVVIRIGEQTGDIFVQPDVSERTTEIESGQPGYGEELLGARFTVSAPSFFQTNTKQAEALVRLVTERLQLDGSETVVDAYAGVGTFAKLLAPHAARVIAIEESKSAVIDAEENVQGIENIEYHQGKVEHVLGTLEIAPDAIILDPPRSGCHKRTLRAVLKFRPRKLIYVSCNPSTLARDLRKLIDGGYELKDVTPVDMFPQTYHIESVTTLELASE
ncbi:MAG: 23S rRNA (uracil(1939)-C(5))-methyltransferase RlmD [Thermomicrobiales bacterium]